MLVDIEAIQINPARGVSSPEQVKALSQSMSEIGLLNPITIGEDNVLIAGLHRLEAAKNLVGHKLSAMFARSKVFEQSWQRSTKTLSGAI